MWTTEDIRKGDIVCEYEGEKLTWKECVRRENAQTYPGAYTFYITERNCVDSQHTPWAMGRYANDACGITRIEGIRNNCRYEVRKGKPFIVASRTIKAGSEILVSYGRSYWRSMEASLKSKASEFGEDQLSETQTEEAA